MPGIVRVLANQHGPPLNWVSSGCFRLVLMVAGLAMAQAFAPAAWPRANRARPAKSLQLRMGIELHELGLHAHGILLAAQHSAHDFVPGVQQGSAQLPADGNEVLSNMQGILMASDSVAKGACDAPRV